MAFQAMFPLLARCTHLQLTHGRSKRRLLRTLRKIQVNRRIKRELFNRSAEFQQTP